LLRTQTSHSHAYIWHVEIADPFHFSVIYTHVLDRDGRGVAPPDRLG
jgi:hypothetical protein